MGSPNCCSTSGDLALRLGTSLRTMWGCLPKPRVPKSHLLAALFLQAPAAPASPQCLGMATLLQHPPPHIGYGATGVLAPPAKQRARAGAVPAHPALAGGRGEAPLLGRRKRSGGGRRRADAAAKGVCRAAEAAGPTYCTRAKPPSHATAEAPPASPAGRSAAPRGAAASPRLRPASAAPLQGPDARSSLPPAAPAGSEAAGLARERRLHQPRPSWHRWRAGTCRAGSRTHAKVGPRGGKGIATSLGPP